MEGYAKLGLLMGEYPELAIFRRYAALNAQNILYLQAELAHLESEFRKFAQEDEISNIEKRRDYSKDWYSLQRSISNPGVEDDNGQWKTFLKIRAKLKEYSTLSCETIILVTTNNSLRSSNYPAKGNGKAGSSQWARPQISAGVDEKRRFGSS